MQRLNWRGARRPSHVPLEGETVRLEPLDPSRHGAELFTVAAGADSTWDYLAYGPFRSRDEFMQWLEERAPLDDPLTFVIIDSQAGAARGLTSLMRIDAPNGVIEVGHIWLSPPLQRTRQSTDALYVQARYVFEELGYRRFEWKCDALNEPSRRAALRFGFIYEGIFRQHMVIKDRNRDTAWFSMLDSEWPSRRAAFEAWLSPSNFNADGSQKRSLAELRNEMTTA